MFFSSYKVIISNDEVGKKNDNHINKKDINFKKLCDFEIVFLKTYKLSSFSSLKRSKFSKNSKRINDLNF